MIFLFGACLIGATYSYFLYPFMLAVLAPLLGRRGSVAGTHDISPKVSLIITAHNEETRIREKLENSLAIEYPMLEIIVASDCSSDGTDKIVESFASSGVRLVRVEERRGKEFAQLKAIEKSSGDILVFSDAGTRIAEDGIARLTGYFADPSIGAVSSEDRFIREDGMLVGEGAYVRYEMAVRRYESRLGGLVGLSGSFFSVRREICNNWDVLSPSDFVCALNCARSGLTAITAEDVIGYYKDLVDPRAEFQRKVRTVMRGMTGLFRHWQMMSLVRYGFFGWQLFSHKLMRWTVPAFLAGLLVVSVVGSYEFQLIRFFLIAQIFFYGLALGAHWSIAARRIAIVRLAYFFCLVNVATAVAWLRYLTGTRMTTWQPSVR